MCIPSFSTPYLSNVHTLNKQTFLTSLLAYSPFNLSSCPSDLSGTLSANPARQHLIPGTGPGSLGPFPF